MRSRRLGPIRLGVLLVGVGALAGGAFAQVLSVEDQFFGDENSITLTTDLDLGDPFLSFVSGGGGVAIIYSNFSTKEVLGFSGLDEVALFSAISVGEVTVAGVGNLLLASESQSQRYLVDSDEDDELANHIWYENSTSGATDWRMMQLTEVAGGSLFVGGPVTQNHSFDLAEAFWEQGAVEPGEVVAVDPERPDAVRLTTSPYQATILGVASAHPGFVLGGGTFSLEALERTWGAAVAEEYRRLRPELEERVLAELPDLADEAERLRSLASFEDYLARQQLELEANTLGGGRPRSARPEDLETSPEALRGAYDKALGYHEESMFDRTVQRFFKDRFTTVALAGRVPVKVDAAFGAIQPGDYLTSSTIAGVAMKATGPGPVIGTALEPLAQGSGLIQVFVHRGWYGGEGVPLAGARPAAAATRAEAKEREIAELRRRLAALEARLARLDRLDPPTAIVAGSAGASIGSAPNP